MKEKEKVRILSVVNYQLKQLFEVAECSDCYLRTEYVSKNAEALDGIVESLVCGW